MYVKGISKNKLNNYNAIKEEKNEVVKNIFKF